MLKVQCDMCKSLQDFVLGLISVVEGNGFVQFLCTGCGRHVILMQPKAQNILIMAETPEE